MGTERATRNGSTTVIRVYGVLAAIFDDAVEDRRVLPDPIQGFALPEAPAAARLPDARAGASAGGSAARSLVPLPACCGLSNRQVGR